MALIDNTDGTEFQSYNGRAFKLNTIHVKKCIHIDVPIQNKEIPIMNGKLILEMKERQKQTNKQTNKKQTNKQNKREFRKFLCPRSVIAVRFLTTMAS